ncbi:MAG: hypothetical protein ACREJ3_00350, partial [Polyangiaceae bacterium]
MSVLHLSALRAFPVTTWIFALSTANTRELVLGQQLAAASAPRVGCEGIQPMSSSNKSRETRGRLVEALRRELMGPGTPDEVINEYPTSRYLVGRLAPARAAEDDTDAAIDPAENDTLAVGGGDDEDGEEETSPPLIIGFNPSSFGLSFLVDANVQVLRAKVSWGDYRREKAEGAEGASTTIWRRYHREALIDGIRVGATGSIERIALSPSAKNPVGTVVTGVDDPEIALEGVVHDFAGYRAISLFLINRRTKGALGDRSKDERWIYQPRLLVTTTKGDPIFVAKDFQADPLLIDDDGEAATNALLYRHAREFATGHGVAAEWDAPTEDGRRTTAVFTEFMPKHEVPLLIAPSEQTGG